MFPPNAPTPSFPYRVLEKVGEGAMGAVYRAEDLELSRRVAIKVIKPALLASLPPSESREVAQRFLQEARAAAALTHPGVVTVHRVGTESGWPFIAMEWLDGKTLEALLKERHRFPQEQVARLGLQVLGVLAAAHEAGVVHRDIKPANLMVSRDGRIKVADFGVARLQGASLAHTQAGMVLGTPQYAAPEQLAGLAVDCRADLYALGGVLYEALVGRPAFASENLFELIHLIQTRPPTAPSSLVSGVSLEMDHVLLQALAKHANERFASAHQMAAALQPLAGRRASPPPSKSPPTPSATVSPTLARVPSVVVEGATAAAMVVSTIRKWPATPVARQPTAAFLERLLERPLHAPAFCGAVEVPGACLLVCDGIIYAAFDAASTRTADEVIDALPPTLDATLHAVPPGLEPRTIVLLASLLHAPSTRLAGLDSSFADLPQLAARLSREGFDGTLRFARGSLLGFALFSKGRRVLDVIGAGWPATKASHRWEEWIAGSGALASVEDRQTKYPAITFRQQLRDLPLEVVRPKARDNGSLLADTRAEAKALMLRPKDTAGTQLRRGDSTLHALVEQDPAFSLARWVLVDLAAQFEQFGRAAKWKALVEPLPTVKEVRLHHAVPGAGGAETFDVATYGDDGRLIHLVESVTEGTRQRVERFVERVLAVKQARAPNELGGAVLVAPRFTEDGLAAYLAALKHQSRALFAGLDAFTHREGFVRLGALSAMHLLLVEDVAGNRRPLMPG